LDLAAVPASLEALHGLQLAQASHQCALEQPRDEGVDLVYLNGETANRLLDARRKADRALRHFAKLSLPPRQVNQNSALQRQHNRGSSTEVFQRAAPPSLVRCEEEQHRAEMSNQSQLSLAQGVRLSLNQCAPDTNGTLREFK
jgi:hypothetical protein